MDNKHMKTCSTCYMDIDSRAKKCPYCHHWQGAFNRIIYHPSFPIFPIVLLIILITIIFTLKDKPAPEKNFDFYRSKIQITNSKMDLSENKRYEYVNIIGMINIDTDVSWEGVHFEAKFYDKNKNLIDTSQEDKFNFVLPAHEKIPFKVSFIRQRPKEDYSTYEVRIISAKKEFSLL